LFRPSLSDIPVAIYDTNMYPGHMLLDRRKHVSVADKVEIFKEDRWDTDQRRIDPSYKGWSSGITEGDNK